MIRPVCQCRAMVEHLLLPERREEERRMGERDTVTDAWQRTIDHRDVVLKTFWRHGDRVVRRFEAVAAHPQDLLTRRDPEERIAEEGSSVMSEIGRPKVSRRPTA